MIYKVDERYSVTEVLPLVLLTEAKGKFLILNLKKLKIMEIM